MSREKTLLSAELAESFEIPTISQRCENLGNALGPVELGYTPYLLFGDCQP
jgi:hypothetical protein